MGLIKLDTQDLINQIEIVTSKGVYDVYEAKNRISLDLMAMRELEFITPETFSEVIEYVLKVKEG